MSALSRGLVCGWRRGGNRPLLALCRSRVCAGQFQSIHTTRLVCATESAARAPAVEDDAEAAALLAARTPGSREGFANPNRSAAAASAVPSGAAGEIVAYAAVGSNLGNRSRTIHNALKALSAVPGIRITNSSFLYETQPQGVTDQPLFLNAAIELRTTLAPRALLHAFKEIESKLGRLAPHAPGASVRWGPRPIDIDILSNFVRDRKPLPILTRARYRRIDCLIVYGDQTYNDDQLTIPHPRMVERDFVLGPLSDICPDIRPPVPGVTHTIRELWTRMQSAGGCGFPFMYRVVPTDTRTNDDSGSAGGLLSLGFRTYILGILNTTPDSFSDGGKFASVDSAVAHAQTLISSGADILDIGGQSTRPGAPQVSAAEESSRVIPVIHALRARSITTPISVDTYRAEVARAAIMAGANVVNDISGGLMDPDMMKTVARFGVPYIVMHTRGTPATMAQPKHTTYRSGDVVTEVRTELEERIAVALQSGIWRWNLIADPGIGFAKTASQSVALLRGLERVRPYGLPLLSGPSRKSFIGRIIQRAEGSAEPEAGNSASRRWGTGAAVTSSIAGGADFIRVHDCKEMMHVAAVADAIYRPSFNAPADD